MFKPRPNQELILKYTGGKMGVSAVPGSGKTHTLSRLAANILLSDKINDDQEILIVTLVNSAVNNFSKRIEQFITDAGLLPGFGFRVRTLHGLAHDIVRERPGIVGLSNQFQIIDEREVARIMDRLVTQWIHLNPDILEIYQDPDINTRDDYKIKKNWEKIIHDTCINFIRVAKDHELTPEALSLEIIKSESSDPIVKMGLEVYEQYQRALYFREAVDFDDLIQFAIRTLTMDSEYLERLRSRWPYILEDEAQDSSRLQEKILRLLSGETGNWVRVGDPNQAIFETFTTANPKYLKDFLYEPGVRGLTLPNSGRSTKSIISLANELIRWTNSEHPVKEICDALSPPYIEITPPDDPQPNPVDNPDKVYLYNKKITPDKEIDLVAKTVKDWLKEHPTETAAILVLRNERGAKMVEKLKDFQVDYVEILKSSSSTRKTSSIIASVLQFLAEPSSPSRMVNVFLQLCKVPGLIGPDEGAQKSALEILKKCPHLEDYLYPSPGADWLADLLSKGYSTEAFSILLWFKSLITRWQSAVLLPIDQLILTFSQDIFTDPVDLALSHKLSLLLGNFANAHPDWRFIEFISELNVIVSNERNFLGFSTEDTGFDPDKHQGKVTVATVHKAKGLEWDRVYLMSVNTYDYPSGMPDDEYYSEKWMLKDRLNFQAEAMAKLNQIIDPVGEIFPIDLSATIEARHKLVSERLRLLFVGITRARKELIITWNTGQKGISQEAIPFKAICDFWEREHHDP